MFYRFSLLIRFTLLVIHFLRFLKSKTFCVLVSIHKYIYLLFLQVNLKYGMKSPNLINSRETCTACAGTIILEFASLSRLTGEPIFEEKARQAMDYLWSQRHRGSDLVGTVLNVHSGKSN